MGQQISTRSSNPPATNGPETPGIAPRPRREDISRLNDEEKAAVLQLSRLALTQPDISVTFDQSVRVLAEVLRAEYAQVLETVPGGEGLLLTAGTGWEPGYVGQVVVPLLEGSQAAFTLASLRAVVVEDLASEKRFVPMPFLLEHGVTSGVGAVIRGFPRPFGILSVYTPRRRSFRSHEAQFLVAVADVLAAALARRRTEEALRDSEQRLYLAMEAGHMGTWEWHIPSGEIKWSESLERIHGLEPETFPGTFDAYLSDIHPEDRERVLRTIQQSLTSGQHEIEYRIIWPDGSVHWLTASGALQRAPSGEPLRMVGICMDATERKRWERALLEAEERYRSLFENAVFGVFRTTREGRFVNANDALARIFGYESPQDLIASVTDIARQIHVDSRSRAEFARLLEENEAVSGFEAEAYRKDGSVIWISLTGRSVRAADGAVLGYEGIVEDITDRKVFESALRESQAKTSAIVNTAVDGIITIDECGIIESFNPAASRIFGYEPAEVLGRNVKALMPEPYVSEHDRYITNYLETGEKKIIGIGREVTGKRKDGSTFPMELSVSEVRLDGRRMFTGMVRDITGRKLAEERQAFLAEASALLYSSLDYGKTLANVARLVATKMADLCSIDMVEEGSIRRVAVAHADPAREGLFAGMDATFTPPPGNAHPVIRVTRSRQAELYADVPEEILTSAARDARHLRALRALKARSAMIVPFIAGGEALGTITFVSTQSTRRYTQDDLVFAQELARRAAIAVDNAQRYRAEQAARREAEEAESQSRFLAEATKVLASSLDYREALRKVAQLALPFFGEMCIIALSDEDGSLTRIASAHADPSRRELLESLNLRPPSAAGEPAGIKKAVRTGRPEIVEGVDEEWLSRVVQNDSLQAALELAPRNILIVPMALSRSPLGAIAFASTGEEHTYTLGHLRLAEELAHRCSLAIDNARRYEREQAARAKAEAAERRQAFLAEASGILSSSLDYESTLVSVARLCVPFLGDWCAIDILDGTGDLKRVAVVHADPAKLALAEELQQRYPADRRGQQGVYRILRSGQPEIHPVITDELLREDVSDPELLEVIRALGLESSMSVPLVARGRTLGVVSLMTAESGRHYTHDDLELAREIGRRAGMAVDNARLFSESQRIQDELRRANEAKDEFLGMVSHELRTPITTIYGGSRLLSAQGDRLDDESRTGILKDIEQESERLHRIVEDLLALARVELGEQAQMEPVLIQRIVEKVVAALARRRPARDVTVTFEKDLEPAAGSHSYLEQVLRNLLNNADKYSPAGAPIEVLARRSEDGEIVVSVMDRGPGIAQEEAERIFERFYRSRRTAKQAGGAGIGLSVCKRLIEAQGGRIWAEPREGGGIEVSFALTLYRDAA